jgi:replication factor C small subunit
MFRVSNWNAVGRPNKIDDIVGQVMFTDLAKTWIKVNAYPEALLLVGPPGTGKTTSARVLGMHILGDSYDADFYECNASDDRGIDFVRGFLKQAASTSSYSGERKVILLDEADGLTTPAQDAARQIIENHAANCLFILTANDVSKIRPAIKSRCSIYNFKPVDVIQGSDHLYNVCEKVSVPTSVRESWREHFPRLVRQMNGDLRACVNFLESIKLEEGSLEKNLVDAGDISKAAMGAMADDFMEMRLQFHTALEKGRDKMFVMRSFYQNLSSFFEMDDEGRTWIIMRVYGDMMSKIYEWPDSDYAFLDYFVAKLKGEIENEESE